MSEQRAHEHHQGGEPDTVSPLDAFIARVMAPRLEHFFARGLLRNVRVFPLPHQYQAVDRFFQSPNGRLLLGDEVGLGKTVEAGLILKLLKANTRPPVNNILIVTPAHLLHHWQQTLMLRFDEQFDAVGLDAHEGILKRGNQVICSRDKAKLQRPMEKVLEREWDFIVFDECHHITLSAQKNWNLATNLLRTQRKDKRPYALLLSATPHSGESQDFLALFSLLAPERELLNDVGNMSEQDAHSYLKGEGRDLVEQHFVQQRKADVTDHDGQPLFSKRTVEIAEYELSGEEKEFNRKLREYLSKGYATAEHEARLKNKTRHRQGQAFGFVLTVYQKLAASSTAAISKALRKRLEGLQETKQRKKMRQELRVDDVEDEPVSEMAEDIVYSPSDIANIGGLKDEEHMLEQLLAECPETESKMQSLMEDVCKRIDMEKEKGYPSPKILIFTEFRATQETLEAKLKGCFGKNTVVCLNGSLDSEERQNVGRVFAEDHINGKGAQILVSTEAGGEGIDLTSAHIMYNYDMPWNPMVLEQRIGRIHRYPQSRDVQVINMLSDSVSDGRVQKALLRRSRTIAESISGTGTSAESVQAKLLGLAQQKNNTRKLLVDACREEWDQQQTEQQVNNFLEKARDAYARVSEDLGERFLPFEASAYEEQIKEVCDVQGDPREVFLTSFLAAAGFDVAYEQEDSDIFYIPIGSDTPWRDRIDALLKRRTDLTLAQRQLLKSNRYGPCTFDVERAASDNRLILAGGGDVIMDLFVQIAQENGLGWTEPQAVRWPSGSGFFEGVVFTFTTGTPRSSEVIPYTVAIERDGKSRRNDIESEFRQLRREHLKILPSADSPDEITLAELLRDLEEKAKNCVLDDAMAEASMVRSPVLQSAVFVKTG